MPPSSSFVGARAAAHFCTQEDEEHDHCLVRAPSRDTRNSEVTRPYWALRERNWNNRILYKYQFTNFMPQFLYRPPSSVHSKSFANAVDYAPINASRRIDVPLLSTS